MEKSIRRNAILAQLPDSELAVLRPHLLMEHSETRQAAYEPNKPIADIYFPLTSVYSVVAMADGKIQLEVATVGSEGMVGLPIFLGATSSPQAAFCQVAGDTVRASVGDFRQALGRGGALHALLNRYTQVTMVQVAQNAVCNRSHSLEARMARWMLTTRDRVGDNELPLSQQFLAQMLGADRPAASQTAQRIQARGLIHYRRGTITITDADGLQAMACDCYRIVKAEFDEMRNHRS
jgi:CRP-like cAMP-binding protein